MTSEKKNCSKNSKYTFQFKDIKFFVFRDIQVNRIRLKFIITKFLLQDEIKIKTCL